MPPQSRRQSHRRRMRRTQRLPGACENDCRKWAALVSIIVQSAGMKRGEARCSSVMAAVLDKSCRGDWVRRGVGGEPLGIRAEDEVGLAGGP